MEQLFEQSVLSKLPDRYKSHLKQSVISEEDDMGKCYYPTSYYDRLLFEFTLLITTMYSFEYLIVFNNMLQCRF